MIADPKKFEHKYAAIAALVLVAGAAACTIIAPRETSTKPRFIGYWMNSRDNSQCGLFPATMNIKLVNDTHADIDFPDAPQGEPNGILPDYARVTGPPTGENIVNLVDTKFELTGDNTLIFSGRGADGWRNCNYTRSKPGQAPQQN